jgi:hypothetical protein
MPITFARACLLSLIATLAASAVQAQARRQVQQPPGELIAAFVHDNSGPAPKSSVASVNLMSVLLGQAEYPSSSLATVLEGLERVALTESSSNLRADAALTLSAAGSRDARQPNPGTLARLQRIYAKSDDPQVKAAVVSGLARAAEHPRTLAFLEKVATGDPPDYPGASLAALSSIASHGDAGSPVLKRLHTSGAVQDADARGWLDLVASRGYRVR